MEQFIDKKENAQMCIYCSKPFEIVQKLINVSLIFPSCDE